MEVSKVSDSQARRKRPAEARGRDKEKPDSPLLRKLKQLEKNGRLRIVPAEEAKKRGVFVWFIPKRKPEELADKTKSEKPD
jgi:hypothetical protein